MITTVKAATAEISTKDILRFIKCFKDFESLPLRSGQLLISDMLSNYTAHAHKIPQLTDQWRWKKQCFGEFWSNLDPMVKIVFLKFWMFLMEGDDAYLQHVERDPMSAVFLKPPILVRKLDYVIMFFENHAIDEEIRDAIDLPALPPEDGRFGNASNWGTFILSLPPQMERELHEMLLSIRDFYPKLKLTNQAD